jgi:hypothetical protein
VAREMPAISRLYLTPVAPPRESPDVRG